MAKQRWATFSVVDHQNLAELVPDILSFDKLVFPYPEDEAEWARWEARGWDPQQLDTRLRELGGLAKAFDWGASTAALYRTRLAQAQHKYDLAISKTPNADGAGNWALEQQVTRNTVGDQILAECGDDCWLLPRYGSLAALQSEGSLIPPRRQERRRDRLLVLLGQELALPASANPEKAYQLAIELANDAAFQRARRALNSKQEAIVMQEQSALNDAQEFADLISDFNAQVKARTTETRRGWMFTIIKAAKELADIFEKPVSSFFGAALEVMETATDTEDVPVGPVAVFHHVKKRVLDPAT